MRYAKERGQSRKIKSLCRNINKIIPYADVNAAFENFLVPSGQFISSPKTSGRVKTEFCRAWLARTAEIIAQKPKNLPFCKVAAVLCAEDLWKSQIIIFYDEEYYKNFWNRNTAEQAWLPVSDAAKSFAKERNIKTPLKEKGYAEIISEGDTQIKSALWFYGDI